MLLSPVHGLYEAEYNRVIIEDPTRHSVCPELVVMDVAEQHESYEGNDMGPVEDLQTKATLLTPGLHRGAHCAVSGWEPVCRSYTAPAAISISTPPQFTHHKQAMLSKCFIHAQRLVKYLP